MNRTAKMVHESRSASPCFFFSLLRQLVHSSVITMVSLLGSGLDEDSQYFRRLTEKHLDDIGFWRTYLRAWSDEPRKRR